MDGLLVLDKPSGCTSHDCVARVRRLYGERRVGHAGTLDPAATGVLVLGLGRVTRLLEYVSEGEKAYLGTVVFGIETDTHDADGRITSERDASGLDEAAVRAALAAFVGRIPQVPPVVSAKRIGGQRLHVLHRRGLSPDLPAVEVEIRSLELVEFHAGAAPRATLEVVCGAGTYVRALARDLGAALGVGAHLATLRRTRVGRFTLADAIALAALADLSLEERVARLRPAADAVAHLPQVTAGAAAVEAVRNGRCIGSGELLSPLPEEDPVAVLDPSGALLAIAVHHGDGLQPRKVLAD